MKTEGWGDAATSRGTPKVAAKHWNPEGAREGALTVGDGRGSEEVGPQQVIQLSLDVVWG